MINLIKFVNKSCRSGVGFYKNVRIERIIIRHSTTIPPPSKPAAPKIVVNLRKKDQIPESYTLIHRSSGQSTISTYYPLSILTLVLMVSMYYIFGSQKDEFFQGDSGVAPIAFKNKTQFNIVCGTYLIMNIAGLYYLRRAVLRIWYSPEKKDYRMVLIGDFPPNFTRQVSFKSGELTRKSLDPKNSWTESCHTFRGGFVFFTTRDFPNPQSYYNMVGRHFDGHDD